ncbi:hypothetical protein [Spirosoma aerolatum]|uniref:hypothetical protein n=1 Tax=Spirosoma aerolatum TaxID=1211326 RepID=UPI0009ABEFF2|nr:hypothetical protein [Spirosoma aerolatum]
MDVQYLSDAQGRHTAIVIPIEEWNTITAKHQDLKALEKPSRKPSDFFGTLSAEEGKKIQEYITQSRKEWDRGI